MAILNIEKPAYRIGSSCKGKLSSKITVEQIEQIIGDDKRIDDDPDKVQYSWHFMANGEDMNIWDYKGSRWSLSGNFELFRQLFGEENVVEY